MEVSNNELAKRFKALSDETRVAVMRLLASGEKCACVLLERVEISQPTLSHHMGILVDSGLVKARKAGKWTHYSLNADSCNALANSIRGFAEACEEPEKEANALCCP